MPRLHVTVLLPPLVARGNRKQERYKKMMMLGIGSPGKEPGLFLAGEVVLAGGTVLCVPCQESVCDGAVLHLRQNIPLFLPFPRHLFLFGAQRQGVPR